LTKSESKSCATSGTMAAGMAGGEIGQPHAQVVDGPDKTPPETVELQSRSPPSNILNIFLGLPRFSVRRGLSAGDNF
jgi:hypothetical protein